MRGWVLLCWVSALLPRECKCACDKWPVVECQHALKKTVLLLASSSVLCVLGSRMTRMRSGVFVALFLFVSSCWLYKGQHWQGGSGHVVNLVAGIFVTVLVPHCYQERRSWIPPTWVIRSELRRSMCHLCYEYQQLTGKKGLVWIFWTLLISRAGDYEPYLFQSEQGVTYLELTWLVVCGERPDMNQKAVLDE